MQTSHPKGLYLLFATEMWERFSYYGMRALFVLYLVKALAFSSADASQLYGSFTGLVYLTPLLGGYISDRFWGNRRSIVVGGILMALGQFSLFLSASYYNVPLAFPLLYLGLGLLIMGNGFFKPNISSMVGQLYKAGDSRVDSAYTIFYMGINIGAFFSPLVCGTFGDTNDPSDFRWGFLAACVGMIVGVLVFVGLREKYLVSATGLEIGMKPKHIDVSSENQIDESVDPNAGAGKQVFISALVAVALLLFFYFVAQFDLVGTVIFSACIAVPVYIITDPLLTSVERKRILVIYILAFFVIFFWVAYEQAGASITLFTEDMVDRTIGTKEIATSYFQSLNAIFVVILAPIMSIFWTWCDNKHPRFSLSVCQKQALGILLLALSYAFLVFYTKGVSVEAKASMFLVVWYYLLTTVGELALSPIGLSMVNKLSPARFASLLMGVWLMSSAAAQKLCGMMSSLYPSQDKVTGIVNETSFFGYQIANIHDFFLLFVIFTAIAAVALFAISPWLNKLMKG